MASIFNGKLQKMKFTFYDDETFKATGKIGEHEVMYNPTTLDVSYGNSFDGGEKPGEGTTSQKFTTRGPRNLNISLTFDGTGASPTTSALGGLVQKLADAVPDGKNNIHKRIKDFLDHAYKENGEIHRPNYIEVTWGSIIFRGVLTTASVTYKMFKPDGTPLRADMKISLKEHITGDLYARDVNRLSPDLTRAHTIVQGDRIDALCEKYYGDSSLYHEVARVNNLTNTRKLIPGNTLVFPPIDKRN